MDEPSHFPDSIRHKDFYRARNEHTDQGKIESSPGFGRRCFQFPRRDRETQDEKLLWTEERGERGKETRGRARGGVSRWKRMENGRRMSAWGHIQSFGGKRFQDGEASARGAPLIDRSRPAS